MSDNKSYRIKANIQAEDHVDINLNLNQDIDVFEFLSMKIGTQNFYRLHTADYGCVAGRVLANNSVGVPNVKISIFIEADEETKADSVLYYLYPYSTTNTVNDKKIKYNLLPEDKLYACHQNVGTFPSKSMVLDDNNVFEIFDKYYKFTTTTNSAGDYMIFGVPTGAQILHMDVDLSDIGDLLSQRPRDFIYKGYNATQFENSNMFKKDNNLHTLVQIMSQDETVDVHPFWGEAEEMGELDSTGVRITRKDINLNYKFEPTCVFMGSLISDEKSNGFTARCIPTERMGKMDRLTTGEGTIEMIRKTPDGEVEEYSIQGNQLIDGDGTWCYQIPMNLDYVRTDEYGNIVPTTDIEKGMPTRARVRFRFSLTDFQSDYQNNHLVKMLVPNNPDLPTDSTKKLKNENNHYVFGTHTPESDFRDLFWNKVYSVKSYIPRLQKSNWNRDKRFSGIKAVNVNGGNNPIPYNNMRINITFLFTLQCAIMHILLWVVGVLNGIISKVTKLLAQISNWPTIQWDKRGDEENSLWPKLKCITIGDGACPDLEGWYFAPGCSSEDINAVADGAQNPYNLLQNTYNALNSDRKDEVGEDENSIDRKNEGSNDICLTNKIDYFIQCIEIALAQEYEVIQFDFYNDWINGLLYIPRWFGKIKKKRSYLFGLIKRPAKTLACIEGNVNYQRRYTQQCALEYEISTKREYVCSVCGEVLEEGEETCPKCGSTEKEERTVQKIDISTANGCKTGYPQQVCHRGNGRKFVRMNRGGYVREQSTSRGEYVYYFKPCGTKDSTDNKKINYFATDIILLGSLNEHDIDGIPQTFKGLVSSTYQMPTNLAATNMDVMGYMYGNSDGASICKNQQFVTEYCREEDKRPAGVTKGDIASIFKYAGISFHSRTYREYLEKDCGLNIQRLSEEADKSRNRMKRRFRDETSEEYKYCAKVRDGEVSLLCAAYSDGSNLTSTPQVQKLPDTFSSYKTWGSEDDKLDNNGTSNDESEYEITEASGIDWGYTGPGQGEPKRDYLYQPGGHFLGIACFNAESNIKSCINLSRVCEIGATLSQRQIVPVREGNDNVTSSGATVPTGFISRDEITDTTFRAEFATLNHSGLLATKKNPLTNRLEYDFALLTPVDFDGSFNRLINDGEVKKLYNNFNGIDRESAGDENGNNKTVEKEYTRTVEKTSIDYVAFRLGLFSGITKEEIGSRFLNVTQQPAITKGSSVNTNGRRSYDQTNSTDDESQASAASAESAYYSLPMYNNSYYFYFGLHDGATALDRFYKEFYAECPSLNEGKIVVSIITKDANPCDTIYPNMGSAVIRILGLDPGAVYSYEVEGSGVQPQEIADKASIEDNFILYIGSYTFILKLSETGEEIHRETFRINRLRPEWLNDIKVSFKDFTKQKYDGDLEDTDGRGKVRITWPMDSEVNSKLTGIYVDGNTEENLLEDRTDGLGIYIIEKFLVAGNQNYTVRVSTSCGDFEIYSFYCSMPMGMDILIGGSEEVTYKKTIEKKYGLDPESEWWAEILSGGTDEEKFFVEKAIAFNGSLANWDTGSIDVRPANGSDTIVVNGVSESIGNVIGNRKKLYLASGETEGYNGPSYSNFALPTRNVPSEVGYTIVTDLSTKTDYFGHLIDHDENRLPPEPEEEGQVAKEFRLPSIYKPFFFRAIMLRCKTRDAETGEVGEEEEVPFAITVANGNLYGGILDRIDLYEAEVIKNGNIGGGNRENLPSIEGQYVSKDWWNNTNGYLEDFPIFRASGVTKLEPRTPGMYSDEYNVLVRQREPDMSHQVFPTKIYLDEIRFVGDKRGASSQYSTNVKYFKLVRTDVDGSRMNDDSRKGRKAEYFEILKEGLSKIHTSDANGIAEGQGEDGTIYWSGSCTKAFTISADTNGLEEYFIFNPSINLINTTKVFSGEGVLNDYDIDEEDAFVLGIYDPWTQLNDDEFLQIANNNTNMDAEKYDFVGKDMDMLTVIMLYDGKTFKELVENTGTPVLRWKEGSLTAIPVRGVSGREIPYERKFVRKESVRVSVSPEVNWLSVTVDSDNDVAKINAQQNSEGSPRWVYLTLYSTDHETLEDTIMVYQNDRSGATGYVSWSADTVEVAPSGVTGLVLNFSGEHLDTGLNPYAKADVDWITVVRVEGMYKGKATITVEANTGVEPRTATLTIFAKDVSGEEVSDTCTIIQPLEPSIGWLGQSVFIPSGGTNMVAGFTYENVSVTDISARTDANWILDMQINTEENTVSFRVPKTTSAFQRKDFITLFIVGKEEYSADLQITQAAGDPYLEVSTNRLEFTYLTDPKTLTVTGTCEYNISIEDQTND